MVSAITNLGKSGHWSQHSFDRTLTADVSEFNWDEFDGHSIHNVHRAVSLLDHAAESISKAANLPLMPTSRADRLLQYLEEVTYHNIFRLLVAGSLTILVIAPLLWIFSFDTL